MHYWATSTGHALAATLRITESEFSTTQDGGR